MRQYILTILIASGLSTGSLAQVSEKYTVRFDQPKQTIWGLGIEIQNDAIGSGNIGLPDDVIAIPNNLVPSERKRLYKDMLKGFRYCRLAMGLYFRGLDADRKRMKERYPNQMKDLKELMKGSGMEGISLEYWSVAPYWKNNNSFIGGTLKSFEPGFLDQFGDALADDAKFMEKNGLKVSMWGLQNEAGSNLRVKPVKPAAPKPVATAIKTPQKEDKLAKQSFSTTNYTAESYYKAFKAVAPKIRAAVPEAVIMAESWDGHLGIIGKELKKDPEVLKYIDAWVLHRIGANSNILIDDSTKYSSNTDGKTVFSNEFEYFSYAEDKEISDENFVNTAQTIMNWMTFANSPTWFWLHALKPTYNEEAQSFALGVWRPQDDNNFKQFASVKKGYWDYNAKNFNAIAGFLKYMPWDSKRYQVDEHKVHKNNRIMAFKTPKGKLVLVMTNRSGKPFQFKVNLGNKSSFKGYRYTPDERDIALGRQTSAEISPVVPNHAVEFWIEQ